MQNYFRQNHYKRFACSSRTQTPFGYALAIETPFQVTRMLRNAVARAMVFPNRVWEQAKNAKRLPAKLLQALRVFASAF